MSYSFFFAMALASGTLASASIITQICSPPNQTAVSGGAAVALGTTSVTCAGFAAAGGFTITGISHSFLGTFSDSDGSNGVHQLTFSGTTPYGSFGPFNTNSDGEVGSTGDRSGLATAFNLGPSIGAFQVSVSVANTVVTNFFPATAQFTVTAVYTYEAISSGVPEPATMSLVAGAIIAAGLRRLRVKAWRTGGSASE